MTLAEFLLAAAGVVLATVALGLVRVLRGPSDADRMMAAQLLGMAPVLIFNVGAGPMAAIAASMSAIGASKRVPSSATIW